MATKKPLVLYSGSMQELGAADRLDYVQLVGDTMTGNLTISKATPQFILNKAASGQAARIMGTTAGVGRWSVELGDTGAESGSNVGSSFRVFRHNDAGAAQDGTYGAFAIQRSDGSAFVYNAMYVGGTIFAGPTPFGGVGQGQLILNSTMGAGTGNAVIESRDAGTRAWTLELGTGTTKEVALTKWNGASNLGTVLRASWSSNVIYSSATSWNHTGAMAADRFYWIGSVPALVPQGGTYGTDGTTRWNIVWDTASGQGDTGYGGHYHQPGVVSFWQVNQAGVFLRYRNDGHLLAAAAFDVYSDIRTKFDIEPIDNVRERVEAAPVRTFRKATEIPTMVGPAHPSAAPRRIGVLAQELEVHTPEAVTIHATDDYPDLRSVDASALGALALAGVQDLYARLDAALSRILELEQQLNPAGTA
ncbi:tail fiber domain-containing protein [Xenophilus aerolatus]